MSMMNMVILIILNLFNNSNFLWALWRCPSYIVIGCFYKFIFLD